jgi:hypothetical protein
MDLHSSKRNYITNNNFELDFNLLGLLQLQFQTSTCNLGPNLPRQPQLPLCKRSIMHFYIFPLGYSILHWKALQLKEILTKHLNKKVKMLLKVVSNLRLHVIQGRERSFIFQRSYDCHCHKLRQFQKFRKL